MVKPAIPTTSNSNQSLSHQSSAASTNSTSESGDSPLHREYYPHLLFLQNKCSAEDFKPASVKMMQDLYRKAFHKSKMHIESGMHLYDNDSNDNSCSIDGLFHNLNTDRCGNPVNLFLLPSVEESQGEQQLYIYFAAIFKHSSNLGIYLIYTAVRFAIHRWLSLSANVAYHDVMDKTKQYKIIVFVCLLFFSTFIQCFVLSLLLS